MTHRDKPLHDVVTLGSLFGTAPKPELLDLAVRLAHADAPRENLHVVDQRLSSVGPVPTPGQARLPETCVVPLTRGARAQPHQAKR
jgi:hypothetical protein